MQPWSSLHVRAGTRIKRINWIESCHRNHVSFYCILSIKKMKIKNAIWEKPLICERVLETPSCARHIKFTQGPGYCIDSGSICTCVQTWTSLCLRSVPRLGSNGLFSVALETQNPYSERRPELDHRWRTRQSIFNIYSNILEQLSQKLSLYNEKCIYRLQKTKSKCWSCLFSMVSS